MKTKKILVSGAGIAGPTLAYFLRRAGFQVTVVERAPALRLGGQNIDISDAAVDIVKLMGIEQQILDHNTTERGLQFVNSKNEVEASFPKGGPLAFTSKYEILRGDLSQILVNLTADQVEYRFGDRIESLEDREAGVTVKFASGLRQKYDLILAADGVGSQTRRIVLGVDSPYKYLGVYTSYATLPKRKSDQKWARWYNATGGRVLLMRPDNKGTTRASVNFWHDGPPEAHFTNEEAIQLIRQKLTGAGWESERIARDLPNDKDLYLGPVSQVRLDRWWKGRCALVGDAAYCPTPFTGMGTTLAIIGAYVLAGELATTDDHEQAFTSYEKKLRPYVEDIQRVFPGQFRLAYPQSAWGVRMFNRVVSVFASPAAQKIAKLFKKEPREVARQFELPVYDYQTDPKARL